MKGENMEKLQISYQKAAQLMAFVLDMAEHGEFKQCPQNASSNEKYVIQNENVAKAMKKLVTEAKEYGLVFTGTTDTFTQEDDRTKLGEKTKAETDGKSFGKAITKALKNHRGMR